MNHDVAFTAVSRAPLAKVQAYRKRMDWSFPWASSHGSDFNYDFGVGITEEQQRASVGEYNFTPQDEKAASVPVPELAPGPGLPGPAPGAATIRNTAAGPARAADRALDGPSRTL